MFFQPYNLPADSQFIRFGNNVVVASNVSFECHDVIHHVLNNLPESIEGKYGTYWDIIDIKDNVFIMNWFYHISRCHDRFECCCSSWRGSKF